MKIDKILEATYCFSVKIITHNFRFEKIKIKNNFFKYKSMHIYRKKCNKNTGNTFPKKKE